MMLRRKPHADQLVLELSRDAELERMIKARVAIRAQNEAIRWRVRLMLIETVMLTGLVLVSGFVLGQPTRLVIRGAILVGAGCFGSGLLLIALSSLTSRLMAGRLMTGLRRWRAR
jgi:hypothetical protein